MNWEILRILQHRKGCYKIHLYCPHAIMLCCVLFWTSNWYSIRLRFHDIIRFGHFFLIKSILSCTFCESFPSFFLKFNYDLFQIECFFSDLPTPCRHRCKIKCTFVSCNVEREWKITDILNSSRLRVFRPNFICILSVKERLLFTNVILGLYIQKIMNWIQCF